MTPSTEIEAAAATPGDAASVIAELSASAWALGAVAEALQRGPDARLPAGDPEGRVLALLGLLVEEGDVLAPSPGLAELARHGGGGREEIRATLRQLMSFIDGASGDDGQAVLAQARGSPQCAGLITGAVATLPGLAERLDSPAARILDVGVGVGERACALCQALPRVRIVGIDAFARAIALARQTVDERGLAERIELRWEEIDALEDVAAYELAWVPATFIPEEALAAGLPRVRRALHRGGFLLISTWRPGDGLASAVARWQTSLAGGADLAVDEVAELVRDAGFDALRLLPAPPTAPAILAAQRPR